MIIATAVCLTQKFSFFSAYAVQGKLNRGIGGCCTYMLCNVRGLLYMSFEPNVTSLYHLLSAQNSQHIISVLTAKYSVSVCCCKISLTISSRYFAFRKYKNTPFLVSYMSCESNVGGLLYMSCESNVGGLLYMSCEGGCCTCHVSLRLSPQFW